MKAKLLVGLVFLALAGASAQTNNLTSALQQGLFEEEANRNLDAAISNYQSLATQFDRDRQVAATAIFRLGECYRKLGQTNEAAAQYQRIVREFSDQKTLATLSRQNLTGLGTPPEPAAAAHQDQRELLSKQIALAEQDLADRQKLFKLGTVSQGEVRTTEMIVLQLRQQLAALNANKAELLDLSTPTTDEEDREIRRIQQLIQNSPDLINAPASSDRITPLGQAAKAGWLKVATFLLDHGADINVTQRNDFTPLHNAAQAGNRAMVELLLSRGAEVNVRDGSGRTPLLLAAANGFQAVTEVLLANKANVNLPDKGSGDTPLHLAASNGRNKTVQLLLAAGADPNAKNISALTPLDYAIGAGSVEVVPTLLAANADPQAEDKNGETPLSLAAARRSPEIVKLLLAAKVDPNGGKANLPLAMACHFEDTNIASLLLHAGADPNREVPVMFETQFYRNNYGSGSKLTPLQIATSRGNADLVKLLFKFKADPKAKRPQVNSPLVWETYANADLLTAFLEAGADPNAADDDNYPLLAMAAAAGNANSVAVLLAAGARANPPADARVTPLEVAVENGDGKTIQLLLDANADVNRRNRDGSTPLFRAIADRKIGAAALLLTHGADPNLALPDNGNTPLHWAIGNGDREMVQLLLTNKADVNLRNHDGFTPLDLAKQRLQNSSAPGSPFALRTIPNNHPGTSGSLASSDASSGTLADLLRQHGALDNLPRWDRIEVDRPSANFSASYFWKGTNDWNQFTLLEVLARQYELLQTSARGTWNARQTRSLDFWDKNPCRFPDLQRILIHRPSPDGRRWTVLTVDVAKLLETGDCTKTPPLQWGDVIEIPENDHPVNEHWDGLEPDQLNALLKCLTRQISISLKGTNATISLSPVCTPDNHGIMNFDLNVVPASYALRSVLDQSKLLRASSDLSRVKIIRRDPKTGKKMEWVLDCSGANAPDFWLRDGDVIEVPEK